MLLLDERDVDALAGPKLGLDAARRAAHIVARRQLTTGRVQVADELAWMRVLAGIIPSLDLVGYKEFHRVDQRVRYHVTVFRRSTADCVGIVDGRRITSLRTAATAALAFGHCFGDDPVDLAVIGSGEEAREGLRALAATIRLDVTRVFSPTPANREAYAHQLTDELGCTVTPVGSMREALDGATAAYVATSAAGPPFLRFKQMADLRILAGIGSTRPNQRELIGDVIASAGHVVIDCDDARHEPGDMIEAVAQYGYDPSTAQLLGDYLEQASPGAAGPVVFKSIGSVEQDLVLADLLLQEAHARGVGTVTPPVGSLRIMR